MPTTWPIPVDNIENCSRFILTDDLIFSLPPGFDLCSLTVRSGFLEVTVDGQNRGKKAELGMNNTMKIDLREVELLADVRATRDRKAEGFWSSLRSKAASRKTMVLRRQDVAGKPGLWIVATSLAIAVAIVASGVAVAASRVATRERQERIAIQMEQLRLTNALTATASAQDSTNQ